MRDTPSSAVGDWGFDNNSDGGVIGGLPWPGSFHLVVQASFLAGITDWSYLSGTGNPDVGVAQSYALDPSQPLEIIASGDAVECRADCTLPTCGDGHLDPGEVCDDGNDAPGDGCVSCLPEP